MQDVADEQNSLSFISKFEKGESNISFHRLEHLLERLNISIEEFLYLRAREADYTTYHYLSERAFFVSDKFTFYLNQIFKCNDETNHSRNFSATIPQMTKLQKEIKTGTQSEEFLKLLCRLLCLNYQLNHERDQGGEVNIGEFFAELQQLSQPVVKHLYNVENWGVYEVLLFRFFQFSFPVETVHQLLRTAVSRTEKEAGVQLMQLMKFELLFGTCTTFINFRKLGWAREVLQETEKLLLDQGDLLNSTKLLFYQGWLKIIADSIDAGRQNCEQAISIFRILKQPTWQKMYETLFQAILTNRENINECIIFS